MFGRVRPFQSYTNLYRNSLDCFNLWNFCFCSFSIRKHSDFHPWIHNPNSICLSPVPTVPPPLLPPDGRCGLLVQVWDPWAAMSRCCTTSVTATGTPVPLRRGGSASSVQNSMGVTLAMSSTWRWVFPAIVREGLTHPPIPSFVQRTISTTYLHLSLFFPGQCPPWSQSLWEGTCQPPHCTATLPPVCPSPWVPEQYPAQFR